EAPCALLLPLLLLREQLEVALAAHPGGPKKVAYDEKQGLNGRRELRAAVLEAIASFLEDVVERTLLPGRFEEPLHRVSDIPARGRLRVSAARNVKLRDVRDESAVFLENSDGESEVHHNTVLK